MNGRERILAAVAGRMPDRVPVMLHNFMMAVPEAGLTQARYRSDPEAVAKAHIDAVERYGYDGVTVDIDTVTLAGALGVPVDFPEHEPARSHHGCLESLEAVDALTEPDVLAYPTVQALLEGVRLLKRHFGDEILVRGNCDQCAFSLASAMRGAQHWMMDLVDPAGRERVERLLEYCCRAGLQLVEAMCETGADMISTGDSPAGPAMISPAMYREFAKPWEQRSAETAQARGKPYLLHICGDTSPIIGDMLENGADILELDYKTDVRMAHDLMRDRCCFAGNIDPSGVLALGKPEGIRAKTRELLEVFADTPRFILNAGCAIPAETPPENLRAMIDCARDFR